MLIDEIKKANIQAMKDHDTNKRGIYSVIINKFMLLQVEARTSGKELGDADVLSIIQKVIKELADEKAGYVEVGNKERVALIEEQEAAIMAYLPKQLNEEEIRNEINKLEDKSIPSIMKHFKTNFAGQVDMGLVSKVAKTF